MARRGRRAADLAVDTRPGKVLALALLANAPVAAGFVLAPLLAQGDPAAGLAFVPWVLVLTPPFALASLAIFFRAPPDRRAHRAARIGLLLDGAALLLWLLVLVLWLAR